MRISRDIKEEHGQTFRAVNPGDFSTADLNVPEFRDYIDLVESELMNGIFGIELRRLSGSGTRSTGNGRSTILKEISASLWKRPDNYAELLRKDFTVSGIRGIIIGKYL